MPVQTGSKRIVANAQGKLPDYVSRHGDVYIHGNFGNASSPIRFAHSREDVDNDEWQSSPFQVADARHSRTAAAKMVKQWNRSNWG